MKFSFPIFEQRWILWVICVHDFLDYVLNDHGLISLIHSSKTIDSDQRIATGTKVRKLLCKKEGSKQTYTWIPSSLAVPKLL